MPKLRLFAQVAVAIVCLSTLSTVSLAQSCPVDTSTPLNIKICSPTMEEKVPGRFVISVSAYSQSSPITTVWVAQQDFHPNTHSFQMDVPVEYLPQYDGLVLRASMGNANNEYSPEIFVRVWVRKTPGTCAYPTVNRTMNWCEPGASGGGVTSPVKIVANATSSAFVSHVKVYVDGGERYFMNDDEVYTYIDLTPGAHTITVQFWDSTGFVIRDERSVTVVDRNALCAPMTSPGVQLCQPPENLNGPAPLRVTARANGGSVPITYMRLYRDAQPIWEGEFNSIDTDLHYGLGQDRTATYGMVAWNAQGAAFVDTANVFVKGYMSPPTCAIPANQTVTLCAPGRGDVLPARTIVSARARWDGKRIAAMRIYVDYQSLTTYGLGNSEDSLYRDIQMSPGKHRIVVVAWSETGDVMVSEEKIVTVL